MRIDVCSSSPLPPYTHTTVQIGCAYSAIADRVITWGTPQGAYEAAHRRKQAKSHQEQQPNPNPSSASSSFSPAKPISTYAVQTAVDSSASSAEAAPIKMDDNGNEIGGSGGSGGMKGWQRLRALKASGIVNAAMQQELGEGDQDDSKSKSLPRMQAMVYAAREAAATATAAAAKVAASDKEASSMHLLRCWVSGAGGSTRTGHDARMVRRDGVMNELKE